MSWTRILTAASAAAALTATAPFTAAQCEMEDFEGFAVDTAITAQIDGVTFSVVPQSCDNNPTLYMRIRDEFYGDNFSSKVLLIDTGCPDFSDDYLRMLFSEAHDDVSFTLGPWAGPGHTYQVRVYDVPSGGAPIETQTIDIPGTGFVDVRRLVQITRPEPDIRRIEIESSASGHEAIDNLIFGQDDTPPTVEIHTPAFQECVCGTMEMTGIVCDYDGAYDRDRLEYMRVWPTTEMDWTLVREYANSPVCDPGSLYTWDTTEPGIIDGVYVLRVTVINACGLTSTAELTVYVDNEFDALDLRSPLHGAIVGGQICFDGTVWERACFDHYVVQYRPAAGGPWTPVDPDHPVYTSTVTNDPFAWWADATTLPDGEYFVAVHGETDCESDATVQITLTLDNTPPEAEITDPPACSKVSGIVEFTGTADDVNLDQWQLQYWNINTNAWTNIETGTLPVIDDVLGTWDTSGLDPCYYAVRLRVWDESIVDICGDIWHHRSDYYLGMAVGDPCPGDLDGDGDVDLADLATLLSYYGEICW